MADLQRPVGIAPPWAVMAADQSFSWIVAHNGNTVLTEPVPHEIAARIVELVGWCEENARPDLITRALVRRTGAQVKLH